jgi:hypothetical protein
MERLTTITFIHLGALGDILATITGMAFGDIAIMDMEVWDRTGCTARIGESLK